MSLIVVTPPTVEPVTLAEARTHLRLETLADDPILTGYIAAARDMAEHELQRSIIAKTYEFALDAFPDEGGVIEIPMGPAIPGAGYLAITSVKYTDTAGVEQTLDPSAYTLDGYSNIPRLAPTTTWPITRGVVNAVRIRYTSGHATAELVPASVRTWILMHVAHQYESREAFGTAALSSQPNLSRLLDPYRSFR